VLKKEERITSKKEFVEVKEKGKLVATSLFSIICLNPPLTPPLMKGGEEKLLTNNRKFGIIVSKKISKKAVERNKIRRRLMEAVRLNKEIFPEGFRGIFLVKKNILDKKEMEIEECLKKLF
jgi:ribonuclease P protein component